MSNARLITDGPGPAVRLERHLPVQLPTVWEAITDRERFRSWFPCDVIVEGGEWEVGRAITFTFSPEVIEMTLTGEVIAVEEPGRLVFTWGEELLHFELSEEAAGTRLVLVDELSASAAARNAAGWDLCLDRLAGITQDPDTWQRLFEMYVAAFEPILGAQEGPSASYKGL